VSQETCRRLVALASAQGMAAARWTPSERRTRGWGRIGSCNGRLWRPPVRARRPFV